MVKIPQKVTVSDILKSSIVKPIIYKYRDWNNKYHQSLLNDNVIYLASPKDFNDPFDCRINKNFSLLNSEEKHQYINDLAIKHFHETVAKGENFNIMLKNFERRMNNIIEFQEFADTNLFRMQDDYYAIFSCSEIWNNILMWSHYADNHKGICIGLKVRKILESGLIGKYGNVKYQAKFPKIKPKVMKNPVDWNYAESFLETHTKAKEWSYEKEVRFMTTATRPLKIGDRIVKISDDFFSDVTLGLWTPEESKNEILELCDKKKIKVFQAEKKDFKFALKRKRIQ